MDECLLRHKPMLRRPCFAVQWLFLPGRYADMYRCVPAHHTADLI